MASALSDFVTAHFYAWERRGRGFLVADSSIQLEPPFQPFFFHPHRLPSEVLDDSKRPTLFSSIIEAFTKAKAPSSDPDFLYQEDIRPFLYESDDDLKVFSLSLPKGYGASIRDMEQLLVMLSGCSHPLSFEIIGTNTAISLQLVCRVSDTRQVISQVKAHFPLCRIQESSDQIAEIIDTGDYASLIELGLEEEFMRPIGTFDSMRIDPYVSLFGFLDHLEEHERIVIQVLFQGAINPWAESIMRAVTDNQGKPFFEDAPEMVPLAKEKIASPFVGVALRVLAESSTLDHAYDLSMHLAQSFGRIYRSSGNFLRILPVDIPFDIRLRDMLNRESHRLGMLLNIKELAALAHFPTEAVTATKLVRDTRKTKRAPGITQGHSLVLGVNEHVGGSQDVTINTEHRTRHCHIIGATGTGKSTLLLNMIRQDIEQGQSIGVLDPHGDLIEAILGSIPESRINDVLLIDPSDSEYPVGFNILSAHSDVEKEILSSDLVAVFRRLSTSWGDQMNSVFANAILAFLESDKGGTLVDLRRFLVEKDFREQYLKTVSDPNVVYYWHKEYPLLRSSSIGPILTRLDTFLRPKPIRYMVAQKKSLDFDALMNSNKIVLMKLSQGLIGAENSYLLGTFLVSKIYQSAMARQAQHQDARNPFYLYVDEFQNFITPSLSSILSGARKYGLGLILAHQDMHQLTKYDSELASSVVSNAGTRVCFRLGDTDAKRFESGFSFFDRTDLENLQRGEAIARIEKPQYDFNFATEEPLAVDTTAAQEKTMQVIESSRRKYGTPRESVEAFFVDLRTETFVKPSRESTPQPKHAHREPQAIPQHPMPPTKHISPVEIEASQLKESLVKKKEQSEHRYVQMYIKKMAEARGFVAKIEEPTPDGKGRVDVSLERNGKRIACEICNTTELEWEMHNLQKCINAEYDLVVACSNDQKTIATIQERAQESFGTATLRKILFFEPEQIFIYLDQMIAQEASTETRIKGYRVKVEYNTISDSEMAQKRLSVSNTIFRAFKRPKAVD